MWRNQVVALIITGALIVAICTAEAERGSNAVPGGQVQPSARPDTAQPDTPTGTSAEKALQVRFQYDGVPYTQVVRRFAQMADKPLIGDLNIEGSLTFFDSQPYTYTEALDTLNILLGMKGYILQEDGRYLRLRQLGEVASATPILQGLDDTKGIRPREMVTVVIPLNYLNPEEASKTAVRLVSTGGNISPLGKGKSIVITDRLDNIRRVKRLLDMLDKETLVDQKLEPYRLKNASASGAAKIIESLFGPKSAQKWQYDPKQKRLVPVAPDPEDVITVSADDRTNTVFLVGMGDKLAMAKNMLEELDKSEEIADGNVRIFDLVNTSARVVAENISDVLPRPQDRRRQPDWRISADEDSNRLIVSASVDLMATIEQLITKLDAEAVETSRVRIVPVAHADPRQLVGPVRQATARRDSRGRMRESISVTADERTGSLVLAGSPDELDAAEKLIHQLDKPVQQDVREVHVVPLTNADARQVARTIQNMFREKTSAAGGDRLAVEAEWATNSVIVSATPQDWKEVQTLLEELKQSAGVEATPTTRIIQLKHAQAETLARTVQNAMRSRHWNRRGSGRIPILVEAAPQTNSLLVTASPTDLEEVATLVDTLDVEPADTIEPFQMIRLQSADAERLAEKLRNLMPQETRGRDATVQIQVDTLTNSVLLRAPETQRKKVEEIIAKLDEATKADARETRLLRLESASASSLASTLGRLYPSESRRGTMDEDEVIITAAPHDRALLIEAPRRQIEGIIQLARSLDEETVSADLQVRTYTLARGDAADIARSLARLFAEQRSRGQAAGDEPQPRFEADRVTNQLMVAATEKQFTEIKVLIEELKSVSAMATQTKTYPLSHAKVDELLPVLQTMLQQDRSRRDEPPVRLSSVPGTNSIIIQGPPEKLAMAEELLATFDTPQAADRTTIRVVSLANAQADSLARSVAEALRDPSRRGQWNVNSEQVTVTAEGNSNSVLVRGPTKDVDSVIEMIKELDADSVSEDLQVRVYPLENSEAKALAENLGRMFRDVIQQQMRARGRGGKVVPFSVSADERTNSLVVSTTSAYFDTVDELLSTLDGAKKSKREVEYIVLNNADAYEVSVQLYDMFRDRSWSDRPVINADGETNTLTLIGTDTDLSMMQKVVAKLDDAAAKAAVRVRVVPLEGVRAERMAEMLQRIYGQMTDSRIVVTEQLTEDKPQPIQPLPAVVPEDGAEEPAQNTSSEDAGNDSDATRREDADDQLAANDSPAEEQTPAAAQDKPEAPQPGDAADKTFQPAPQPTVTIAVDAKSNALLLSGPRRDLEELERLIAQLSFGTAAAEAEVRVFTVEKADPETVATMLDALFNPQTPRVVGRRVIQPEPVITVIPETRTRRLIIRAKPMDFELIEPVLKKLDQVEKVVSEVRIFALKNAQARDVASNLQQLFSAEEDTRRRRTPQGRRREMVQQIIELHRPDGVKQVDASSIVSITANVQSNTVVVAAPTDAMAVLEGLIQEMDQSAAEANQPIVRLYPLANAEVNSTVDALREVFSGMRGRRDEAPVNIAGDESGGVVIVSAVEEKQQLAKSVIEQIEQARGDDKFLVKIYELENSDARSVATALNEALSGEAGGRRGRRGRSQPSSGAIRISPEASSNTLVIRASKEDHETVAQLITEMDVSKTAAQPVRLIPLQSADPQELARTLNRLFQTSRRGQGAASIVIEPDASARALVVRAEQETFERIQAMAQKLDTTSPAGKASQTLITLQHAKAEPVAAALSRAFAPQRGQRVSVDDLVTVIAEPEANSLIVTANDENLAKVRSLVEQLDSEELGGRQTEFVLLKHAEAQDLEAVLTRVAGSTSGRNRRGRGGGQEVAVSAEPGSNALIITGPSVDVSQLMQMAIQLDQAAEGSSTGVYIIPLNNSEAASVAAMVRDLYNQSRQAGRGSNRTMDPLAVTADSRANALVLATSKEMYETVSQWVLQVEQMKPARGQLKVIPIDQADPAEVKEAIDQLFDSSSNAAPGRRRRQNTSSTTGRVETTVLPRQRAVMVSANEEDYQTILELVKTLEQAAEQTKRVRKIFTLEKAPNQRVVQALSGLFRPEPGSGPERRVDISAMPNSNAVVVAAPSDRMEEIGHLIAQLDQDDIAPQLEFRIYPLENAQPTKILPMLQQMLAQIRQVNPGETINVQADERTRSIIVTARRQVFDQVQELIETLDQAPAYKQADVLVIQLEKADANRLAEVLNDMLRPSEGGQVTPEARALQEQVRLLKVRGTMGEDIPELDLTKPIKISADPAQPQGSNALVITSTPDNLKALRAVVKMMDTVPIAGTVNVKFVHLQHADAESAAEILQDIFSQGRQLAGMPGTSVAGKAEPRTETGKALVKPLNVSTDLRTNSLILAGEEEVLALASLLVADLDRKDGRIITEVRLFQLKHADAGRLAPVLRAVFSEGQAAQGAEGLRTAVTRLKTWKDENDGHATQWPKPRPALTIQADEGTNILVVAARSDIMPLIADVVSTMDIPGAGSLNIVRIVPLTHADASRIAQVIDSLYQGPNANLIRDEDRPTVAVDTRTNSLVVSANEQTFTMLTNLLKSLDRKTPVELRDIRLLTLENAEASTLADSIQQMMDARVQRQQSLGIQDAEALRVIVVADERSNSLIVGGSAESFQLVKDIAMQLDAAPPAIGGTIQMVSLAKGNAATAATTLQNLFNQRYQAARTPELRRQRPIILPDVRTNSLLVSANKDDTEMIRSLVEKLDVELTDASVQLVVIPMEHNDAGLVGPMIESIFSARLQSMTPPGQTPEPQNRVDIATDVLSNSLVISASRENLHLIRGLLAKVDVAPPDETGIVRMYPLENADAQRIATMLENLISQGLYKPGMLAAGNNAAIQAREQVSIAVDIRTNVLIVSASKENFAVIEEIIHRVDSEADFGMLGDIRVYALQRADATQLAPTLQQFFNAKRSAEQATGASGRSLPTVIIPDARTNALLVAGSREAFAAVENMVQRLDDKAITPANTFRIFPLTEATASVLQGTLQRLFDQRASRGQDLEDVTILADSRSNSLIIGATPEDMETAESLIAKLDVPTGEERTNVQVFPLKKANAQDVADTLADLYSSGPNAGGELTISVDERSNALLVSGGRSDLKRVAELIAQLDQEKVAHITEIKVFALDNADSQELAQLLMDVLTNKPDPMTNVNPNRQTLLQFIRRTSGGKELISSALQEGVLITADRRTNSLVVSAPLQYMSLLGNLIESLDSTTPRSAEIRVFALENADAEQMALILEQLFRTGDAVGPNRDAPAVTYRMDSRTGEAAAETGSADQYSLTITVDARTNSLLVGGTKHQVEMARTVIEELDSSPAQERITKVYHPKNTQPVNIETALRDFLDQEQDRLSDTLGDGRLGAAQRILEREAVVVAETESNTLLISASPRYFSTLEKMIDELDQPPPQVLIQTLLAEVRLDDTTDLGLDWAYTTTSGNNTVEAGQNFRTAVNFAQLGGFNVSVTGSDLTFFLQALKVQNRLNVLSMPQILANDNQEGRIEVGQRVPFITSSRTTDQGDTINTIDYTPIGINLSVLPRIGSDGTIQLLVSPEISSLSTAAPLEVAPGVRATSFNSTTAETTVTCHDGQTVVIGGLISASDTDQEDKIPVMGDIPLVGLMFRSTTKTRNRNELMIFLTPRILRNARDAEIVTSEEIRRQNAIRMANSDDEFNRDIIRSIKDKELIRQARPGANSSPTPRIRNIENTLRDLELLPRHYRHNPPLVNDMPPHEDETSE